MSNEQPTVKSFLLTEYLPMECILFLRGKQEKENVFNALIDNLLEHSEIEERDDIAYGIFRQDSLLNTCIGKNIATPYCQVANSEKSYIALAIAPEGITDMCSSNGKPVNLVFMIATAKDSKTFHTQLISCISDLFFNDEFRESFLESEDAIQAYNLLINAEKKK